MAGQSHFTNGQCIPKPNWVSSGIYLFLFG